MTERDIASALHEALVARPEIADRPDRFRAVLADVLGGDALNHRRELALLVAAVEEQVPAALRNASSPNDVDSIATRLQADRSLESSAARWTVDAWSDALVSVGVISIPATDSAFPDGRSALPGNAVAETTMIPPTRLPDEIVVVDTAPRTPAVVAATERGVTFGDAPVPIGDVTHNVPSQRSRRVLVIGGIVALVGIALVVGGIVAFGGDSKNPKLVTDGGTGPSGSVGVKGADVVSLRFPTAKAGKTTLQRTWTLGGDRGSRFSGALVFNVPKGTRARVDEVLPKSLVANSKSVKLTYDKRAFTLVRWVKADPVLRVVPKSGTARAVLRYEITVRPTGANLKRLNIWRADAARARAVWENASSIKIISPASNTHFSVPSAQFVGTTQPGTKVHLLGVSSTVGGPLAGAREVAVDSRGNWSTAVSLVPGLNWVRFQAVGESGEFGLADAVVYYDAPSTGPGDGGTTPPPNAGGTDTTTSSSSTTSTTGGKPSGGGGGGGIIADPPPIGGGGSGGNQSGGGGGTPSSPPVAHDDTVSGYYGDSDTQKAADGRFWWEIVVGKNDTFSGASISVVDVGAPYYGYAGAYTSKDSRLCGGGYLCVWYAPPCDGTYQDHFTYTIKDTTSALQSTATVYVNVTYSNDADLSNDCTG